MRVRQQLPPLEVGHRHHHLVCVSVRPVILRCDCGAELRKRTLSHLQGGMKSCGCVFRAAQAKRLSSQLDGLGFEAVAYHEGPKQRYSTWDVRCVRCGEASTISDTHLRFGRIRGRCGKCPRD